MRAIIFGNSGSGKTTLANRLMAGTAAALLALDDIAWVRGTSKRLPFSESAAQLQAFIAEHETWVIEGCYGELIKAALPHCTDLYFLNPGAEVCAVRCVSRPWEPAKFPSPEKQNEVLPVLLQWVRLYDKRMDEYGLKEHRRIFDGFSGRKREIGALDAAF
jgi:adenylate kinase family enzyme